MKAKEIFTAVGVILQIIAICFFTALIYTMIGQWAAVVFALCIICALLFSRRIG